MSLMTCKDCGASVSTLAAVCPNCGAPIGLTKDKERAIRAASFSLSAAILIVGGVIIGLITIYFMMNSESVTTKAHRVVIKIDGTPQQARVVYRHGDMNEVDETFIPPKTFEMRDVPKDSPISVYASLLGADGDLGVQVRDAENNIVIARDEASGEKVSVYVSAICCVDYGW